MRFLTVMLLWCLLAVVCWPLAILLVVLAPLLWLISLPFQLAGLVLGALWAFVSALLYLPARLLGHRS